MSLKAIFLINTLDFFILPAYHLVATEQQEDTE